MTSVLFHPLCNPEVLGPVVSAHPAWNAMLTNGIQEEFQNGVGTVVAVGSNGSDVSRESVHEAVYNDLPSNEAYMR